MWKIKLFTEEWIKSTKLFHIFLIESKHELLKKLIMFYNS